MPVTRTINSRKITLEDDERVQCEVWDRVMGYFRPVKDWNAGKREEHRERIRYDGNKMATQCMDEKEVEAA